VTCISPSKPKWPAFPPWKEGWLEGRMEGSCNQNDFEIGKLSALQKKRFLNWQACLASVPLYKKVVFEMGKRSALQ